MYWPDDDWHDLINAKLVAWSLRDAEPWVELWKINNEYVVKQRGTQQIDVRGRLQRR